MLIHMSESASEQHSHSQPQPQQPTPLPYTYRPGNLNTHKLGLLLPEGLDTRIIVRSNQSGHFDLGLGLSKFPFHES
jgi:hypothetical protein